MTDWWLACCVIKIRENSSSESVNLFKGEIFAGSSYPGSICPSGAKIGSSYREFREIKGFEKLGLKLYCLSEANPRETRFGSRNRDSNVFAG